MAKESSDAEDLPYVKLEGISNMSVYREGWVPLLQAMWGKTEWGTSQKSTAQICTQAQEKGDEKGDGIVRH